MPSDLLRKGQSDFPIDESAWLYRWVKVIYIKELEISVKQIFDPD
jgi:hypothetical protein